MNPFLDFLSNFGFNNIGLTPGIQKECFQHPQDVVYIPRCDVTKEDDWQDLWTHAENILEGKVSILVNNAGIKPDLGWKPCVDVMLMGVGYGTFLALEKMGISKVHNSLMITGWGICIWTI